MAILLKTTSVRVSSIQIMQVRVQNKVKTVCKRRYIDMSPSYLLFQTLLPLFWTLICMIWMELTRTDVVFSRIALVLFLCRNKVLGMTWNFTENIFGIKKILAKESRSGAPHPVHDGGGRAPCPVGPLELHRPQLQLYIFCFAEKKIRE